MDAATFADGVRMGFFCLLLGGTISLPIWVLAKFVLW